MTKCTKCGEEAVIERDYEGRSLCKKHFSIDINKTVKESIRKNGMIESGDTIAVGLSGGKDSAVLLDQLVEVFGERPDVDIVGVAVHEGIDPYRDKSISAAKDLCDSLDVPLEIGRYSDYYNLEMDDVAGQDHARGNCTYCGVLRRDLLNKLSREIDADKLAIGHNLDDQAQSILMNHLRGDTRGLAKMGSERPVNHSKFVERVKPLRDIPEREVALYSQLHDLGVIDKCPHVEEGGLRPLVKSFLNRLESEMPGVKFSVVSQGRDLSELVLDEFEWKDGVEKCDTCGEPCSGNVCRKCQLLDEAG